MTVPLPLVCFHFWTVGGGPHPHSTRCAPAVGDVALSHGLHVGRVGLSTAPFGAVGNALWGG